MRVNEDKVYRLFDAIGELDPRLVDGALKYKRSGIRSRRIFTVLVAACVAFSILIVGSVGLMISNQKNDVNADSGNLPNNSITSESSDVAEILKGSTSHSTVDSFEMLTGQSTLVWQESGESSYKFLTIGNKACDKLVSLVKNSNGERVDETYVEDVKVWIVCADGSVISPYLSYSAGNVGYGELFEYDPEIEPDENFIEEIKKIIP